MRFLVALLVGVEAFKRALETGPARDQVAGVDPEVEQLLARFYALRAKAASGARGSVAARRELKTVRHELLRRGVAA